MNTFRGIEPVDDDLDARARFGQCPSLKVGDPDNPSLLPPRSTKTLLPRTPMTLPVRAPGRLSWPRSLSRIPDPGAHSDRGDGASKLAASKPARATSTSACRPASHCRLNDTSGCSSVFAERRVERGIDLVILRTNCPTWFRGGASAVEG